METNELENRMARVPGSVMDEVGRRIERIRQQIPGIDDGQVALVLTAEAIVGTGPIRESLYISVSQPGLELTEVRIAANDETGWRAYGRIVGSGKTELDARRDLVRMANDARPRAWCGHNLILDDLCPR